MSRGEQKTKSLLASQSIAGVNQPVFDTRGGIKLAAIQISFTEECLCASVTSACCDVTVACNSFTEVAHGFETGLVGQFTTSCADLPSGLSACTNYYIIDIDACTYKVGSSRANAIAGTAVAIADAGSGCHTFTPTTTSCTAATNGTVTFHASVDGSNYATANLQCVSIGLDKTGSNTVTVLTDVGYNEVQVDVDVLIGQWTIDIDASGKQ